MEKLNIDVKKRTELGKGGSRRIRREGMIPGVCYGAGKETFQFSLTNEALNRLLFSPKGRNTIVELVDGKEKFQVMLHDLQRHPVKRVPIHVDFRMVSAKDVVTVQVPVNSVGTPAGMDLGGRLIQGRRTVAVKCKVADIPDFIEHDVSEMNIGDYVLASQIHSSAAHKVIFKSDFIVFRLIVPKGIEETVSDEVELDEHGEPIEAAADGESAPSGEAASPAESKDDAGAESSEG